MAKKLIILSKDKISGSEAAKKRRKIAKIEGASSEVTDLVRSKIPPKPIYIKGWPSLNAEAAKRIKEKYGNVGHSEFPTLHAEELKKLKKEKGK